MCKQTMNLQNIRRHIKRVHGNTVAGSFTVNMCLFCLEVDCPGSCDGREFRRGKLRVLELAVEKSAQHLGVELKQKSIKVVKREKPQIVVAGKYRQICENSAVLEAFKNAVKNASSYEYS